jgi:hypothetical protein
MNDSSFRFEAFSFNELGKIVKSILRTKKRSSEDKFEGGQGLVSIEALEAHIDDILQEIVNRISEQWTFERIQTNIKEYQISLPDRLKNVFNINQHEVQNLIMRDPPVIGAEINDDCEEIFFFFDNTKYQMKKDGLIFTQPYTLDELLGSN